VVTGSSSGIGRAIALRLAADGFWVLLADVRRDPLTGGEPTDDLIRGSGGACEFARADVSSRPDCDQLVARAVASAGQLDVVVNKAALAEASRADAGYRGSGLRRHHGVKHPWTVHVCWATAVRCSPAARGDARGRIVKHHLAAREVVGKPGTTRPTPSATEQRWCNLTRQIAVERVGAMRDHLQQRCPGQDRHRSAG
jgi:NAD(P)-dependent dehydrogenase (short-subunit alcohol dehydrogenase family)